ncbi:MAG: hypothetical protein AAGF51_01080 [Pseudomonadota bacterium]
MIWTQAKTMFAAALLAMSAGLAAGVAWAQVDVESVVEKEVVVQRNGASVVVREPAERVVPGEVVVYTYRLRNSGDQPASNVAPSTRIPEEMIYISGSAEGPGARATLSADEGASFAPEGEVLVQGEDGSLRPARPEEFTNIRWVLEQPLAPGAQTSVAFKARLK